MSEPGMNLDYAEGWKPDAGDVLVGRVTSVDAGWSDFMSGNYPIVTVQPEDGSAPVAVHCFHTALLNRVLNLRPVVGDRIGIKYDGTVPHQTVKGKTVAKYVVKVEGKDNAEGLYNRMAAAQGVNVNQAEDTAPDTGDDDIPF